MGKLVLEFYIIFFDYVDVDGFELFCFILLKEGNEIGLCWVVIDWDVYFVFKDGFWNLFDEYIMYGNVFYLCKFKLMFI